MLRRRSVTKLEADIREWTNEWNKNPSYGPRPTRSSEPSPPTANELMTQDTRNDLSQ